MTHIDLEQLAAVTGGTILGPPNAPPPADNARVGDLSKLLHPARALEGARLSDHIRYPIDVSTQ